MINNNTNTYVSNDNDNDNDNEINLSLDNTFNNENNDIYNKIGLHNNQLVIHAQHINNIDEKVTLYKQEIDNFNNTLSEIKEMIIDEFDNYDKKFDNVEKNNIILNNKINQEAYIINFIIIGLILIIIVVLFNDIMNNDVLTKFTLIDLFNNEILDNNTIITIIDDSISEL
tara:strand:+ start:318 stop:830 length:513 start_codon:yes stop_codon:yes gene_type:complete